MLYLHIGMPRTGTSSLQEALTLNREALSDQGFDYPDRWTTGRGIAQHHVGIATRDPATAAAIRSEVTAYLGRREGRTVIISTEALTQALTGAPQSLLKLFDACSEITATTTFLMMRRLDAFAASMYLHQMKHGKSRPDVDAYARARLDWITSLFRGIAQLQAANAGWSFEVIPYREGGDALAPVFDLIGIDNARLNSRKARRIGSRLGLKAQSLMAMPGDPVERLGISRKRLIQIFESGRFGFRDDTYRYDVLGGDVRHRLHQHALDCAHHFGVRQYVAAFAEDHIDRTPAIRPDPSLISTSDLDELRGYIDRNVKR